jgi:three-Cys-motif partner protein
VAAFKKAKTSLAAFSTIQVSDANPERLAACEKRLRHQGACVVATPGPAASASQAIVSHLSRQGLHFAFLDPHNLGSLSFGLFESLARLKYIDIIAHVSVSDMRRNTDLYTSEEAVQFDDFAPDWRKAVPLSMNKRSVREGILRHWSTKVSALGLPPAKHSELITAPGNQGLYWLIFLSRAPFAHDLWGKISSIGKAPTFAFDGE